jgi:acyl-coenzyme A synthetase/AMP-(fatty) acid ligase
MHIIDMIYFWARTMPQRPAIIQPDGIVTYRALVQGIESAAEHFARNILDKSKPVAVSIASEPRMLVASFGLLRAGFSIIVAGQGALKHIPPDDATTLVCERGGETLSGRTNILFEESWLNIGAKAGRTGTPIRQPKTKETDVFFFTSGTTGRPKRVVRTQKAWDQRILFNSTSAFADYNRVLLIAGLVSAYGFTRAYETLYAGKTICFAPFGRPMLWLVNTYEIDLIIASPQQALALAEIQEKVTRYPLAALKTIRIGGSVMTRDGVRRIKNHLCRNVIIAYSSTEAGTVAIAPYDMIADIPSAVGFLIPGAEVEIVDAADNVLPAGSEGFVRLRTTQFALNFQIDDPNAWFYPGDAGWLTEAGVLCIAGRKGDVLNRGGVKLSVTDLESFLTGCAGIKDAGVCTVMGESGFDEVWVGLVFELSADIATLRQEIEGHADFRSNIDKLFVVESIPRGTLGKVQRDELRKMLQDIGTEPVSPTS